MFLKEIKIKNYTRKMATLPSPGQSMTAEPELSCTIESVQAQIRRSHQFLLFPCTGPCPSRTTPWASRTPPCALHPGTQNGGTWKARRLAEIFKIYYVLDLLHKYTLTAIRNGGQGLCFFAKVPPFMKFGAE
jgi:hypothetical protein